MNYETTPQRSGHSIFLKRKVVVVGGYCGKGYQSTNRICRSKQNGYTLINMCYGNLVKICLCAFVLGMYLLIYLVFM